MLPTDTQSFLLRLPPVGSRQAWVSQNYRIRAERMRDGLGRPPGGARAIPEASRRAAWRRNL